MNLTSLNQRLLAVYATARRHHEDIQSLISETSTAVRSLDGAVAVDATYVLKRTSELADATRKDLNRCLELVQKAGCMAALHSPDNRLHGQIANGYGSNSEQLIVPDMEREPEQYKAVMLALGVPAEHAVNLQIKPRWDSVADLATKLAEEGKPLPPGLEHVKRVPKFTVMARMKSGVDIDELTSTPWATSAPPVVGPAINKNAVEELVVKLANRIQSRSDVQAKIDHYLRPNVDATTINNNDNAAPPW